MNEKQIRRIIESVDPEGKIPTEGVEELVSTLLQEEKKSFSENRDILQEKNEIFEQMKVETDWRKRSALVAKLISLGYE